MRIYNYVFPAPSGTKAIKSAKIQDMCMEFLHLYRASVCKACAQTDANSNEACLV